jgi:hypothetical protein
MPPGLIDIVVSPEPRNPSNPPAQCRFVAAIGGRVLGAFSAPLCGSARVLLAEGIAPETCLRMRHAGSEVVALTTTVGVAAGLRVDEGVGSGAPRFAKWRPFDRSRLGAAA